MKRYCVLGLILLFCSFVYASKEVFIDDTPGENRCYAIVNIADGKVWDTNSSTFKTTTPDACMAIALTESLVRCSQGLAVVTVWSGSTPACRCSPQAGLFELGGFFENAFFNGGERVQA